MRDFADYIESCLAEYGNSQTTFIYKKRLLDEMELRVKEVEKHGLNDKNVAYDLIVSENSKEKVLNGYSNYLNTLKEKQTRKRIPLISAAYLGILLVVFLILGFLFDLWHPGWLTFEFGISVLVIGILMFIVSRLNKIKWYPLSRILVAGSVMIAAQAIYLAIRVLTGIVDSYLIFLAAPALMFICDTVLATVTKQRFYLINYLITIPVVSVFLYAIFGIIGAVPWHPGWLIIIGGFLADILVVFGVIQFNKKYSYKPEVEDSWKEN